MNARQLDPLLCKNPFLLPCTKEDISTIASRGCFCFPPFDPTRDDDSVSLDTFFWGKYDFGVVNKSVA